MCYNSAIEKPGKDKKLSILMSWTIILTHPLFPFEQRIWIKLQVLNLYKYLFHSNTVIHDIVFMNIIRDVTKVPTCKFNELFDFTSVPRSRIKSQIIYLFYLWVVKLHLTCLQKVIYFIHGPHKMLVNAGGHWNKKNKKGLLAFFEINVGISQFMRSILHKV